MRGPIGIAVMLACAGACARAPARGLARPVDLATATLGYASRFAGERYLVTVELGTVFELVIRDLGRPDKMREIARATLGRAEYDIHDLAVDSRRMRVFVAGRDGRVRGFDILSGAALVTWHLGSPATAVAVSPDSELVVMGTDDGVLCVRRYHDGALLQCAAGHEGRIARLAISPDGSYLVSGSWTGELVRWQLPSLAVVERRSFAGAISALAFAPDGKRLAVARSAFPPERTPEIAARERGGAYHTPDPGHAISIIALDLAPGARTDPGVAARPLLGHGGPITSLAFTPEGDRLASGSWDRTVRLWDTRTGHELDRFAGWSGLIHDLHIDPAGRRIAVAAWSNGRTGRSITLLDLALKPGNWMREGGLEPPHG